MAWYYGTYSCGHEGKIQVYGPIKNREWITNRQFEKMCDECYKKYLEEEKIKSINEAFKNAEEMELPKLTGTEKQINWAVLIRENMIKQFEEKLSSYEEKRSNTSDDKIILNYNSSIEKINEVLNYILENNESSFFINNRNETFESFISKYEEKSSKKNRINDKIEKKYKENIINESAISPTKIKHLGIVEIIIMDNKIQAKYEKNEDFRTIVKGLGYSWNNIWERKIDKYSGPVIDRAAELGNTLLNSGFTISILDEEARNKAIKGNFEVECKNWILRKDDKTLKVWWEGRNEKIYSSAKCIQTSRYKNGVVLVNVSHYAELQDFTGIYNFKFSEEAQEVIDNYIIEYNNIKKVTPIKFENKVTKNKLKEILNSSNEIIEDLLDD